MRNLKMLIVLTGIILIPTVFSSCTKNEIETAPLGSVNVSMYEMLSYDGRECGIQVLTDLETYPATYQIRKNLKIESNKITVDLLDIEKIEPSGAQIPDGPASVFVHFGNLGNGTYELQINVADKINTGSLTINSDLYAIAFDVTDNLTVNDDTLRRIPNGTLWGYVGYNDSSYAEPAQVFVDTLAALGAMTINLQPGNYWYFTVDDDGSVTQPFLKEYNYTDEFFYYFDQDPDSINQVLTYYDVHYKTIDIVINWFYEGVNAVNVLPGKSPGLMILPGNPE